MVLIKKIDWLSKEGLEAIVTISDGEYSLSCFAHPFNKSLGDEILSPLQAVQSDFFTLNNERNFYIEKLEPAFSYFISGKLIDKERGLIQIGQIVIETDIPLPNDLKYGEFVSFRCERLDISYPS